MYECPLHYPALPLTLDNVFEAVKTVRNWRELAKHGLMNSSSDDPKKLDAIQCQHISNEACLKAVIESFLLEEDECQPTWRRLIHTLHAIGESHLAEKTKNNAEPHQGERLREDSISVTILHISHNTCISSLRS